MSFTALLFAEIKVYLSFRISVQMYTKKNEKSLQITVWWAWIEMENKNEMFFESGRKFSVAGAHPIHQHINVSCTTSHHTIFIVICYIICTYLIFMFIIRLFITLLWLLDARNGPNYLHAPFVLTRRHKWFIWTARQIQIDMQYKYTTHVNLFTICDILEKGKNDIWLYAIYFGCITKNFIEN